MSGAPEDRSTLVARIRDFCAKPPHAVLFDETGGVLYDAFAAKTIPLDATHLLSVETKKNKETGAPYLALAYDDGRSVALADVGIAFAPNTRDTGPLSELPDAVCFRDFRAMLDRVKHQLYGHQDDPVTRDTVKTLMMCVATLEGARGAGFDISREEREVEAQLNEVEKRAPKPA